MLPDSETLKEELESSRVNLNLNEHEVVIEDENVEIQVQQPWQSGIFHQVDSYGDNVEASGVRRSNRLKKPNPRYANAAIVSALQEPEPYDQAYDVSEWIATIKEEISALMKNQTWELVPKPKYVKPISCKWVYKVKRKADGSKEKKICQSSKRFPFKCYNCRFRGHMARNCQKEPTEESSAITTQDEEA